MPRKLFLIFIFGLLLAACSASSVGDDNQPATLTVMTHDSFEISAEVLAKFEQANQVKVEFLKAGDTGAAVNKAVLAAGKPLADVFYGVDNTFLSRALDADIFEAYESPMLWIIPDAFKLDPENRALPVDYGDVCLNYDLAYFDEHDLEPPASLDDLLDPAYRGLVAVPNPATSSPGLAFLLATIATYGQDGYLDFWRSLAANDLSVVNDWETVYNVEFSRRGGDRPIVVSYGSSPPFEVLYAEEPMDTPPTGVLTAPNACFRQIEFAGILKGTQQRALAEAWIDFMLSIAFQEDMPLQMYVFPVNTEARLDQVFAQFLAVPDQPAALDPVLITEQREEWIQAWREAVLQ